MIDGYLKTINPNPDEPELKIEDCRLNICGGRFAPFFLKWKEFLKSSLFNRYKMAKLSQY